jgi:hypothetical protein
MAETPEPKKPDEPKADKKEEKSPWNELLGNFLIKAVPALIGGGVSGLIPIVKGDELPKAALYAGIGGVGGGIATIAYAVVEPTLKKTKKGADQVGEAAATKAEQLVQAGIAKATGAEAKYLEAQKLACQTDRCQGFMQRFKPLLEEIFVELSISGMETLPGWREKGIEQSAKRGHYEIWPILRQAEKQNSAHMAILAWGGLGKTTLLKHIAYIYSSEQHDRADIAVTGRTPIFIALGECWKNYLAGKETLPNLATIITEYHLPKLPGEVLKMPINWAEDKLKTGKAIVLLDGLDEVPKDKRSRLAQWIDRQINSYGKSIFIVTSRPKAYEEQAKADRLSLPQVLYVEKFDAIRRRQFLEKWFLYQEQYANNGRDTADVQQDAQILAESLIEQIESNPELRDLAQVPLLLNMIATFYRNANKPKLPQRRVDLYQKICDLQLKDRPEAKQLESLLTNPDLDVQKILQMLALEMLLNNREKNIDRRTIMTCLTSYLQKENETADARIFLEDVVRISELLVEYDADSYEFAHWSFQEYLAAKEILDTNQVDLLVARFNDAEWKPTILLYATMLKRPGAFVKTMLDRGVSDLADATYREVSRKIEPGIEAELKQLQPALQDLKYEKLEKLLQAGEWEAADEETYRLMITTVGKEEGQWFDREDLENFPCADLLTIDRLWVSASKGHFGFSVQKKIWEECGAPKSYDEKDWREFGDRVGWRRDGDWLSYYDFHKTPSLSPVGELPARVVGGFGVGEFSFLAPRLVNCSTPQS